MKLLLVVGVLCAAVHLQEHSSFLYTRNRVEEKEAVGNSGDAAARVMAQMRFRMKQSPNATVANTTEVANVTFFNTTYEASIESVLNVTGNAPEVIGWSDPIMNASAAFNGTNATNGTNGTNATDATGTNATGMNATTVAVGENGTNASVGGPNGTNGTAAPSSELEPTSSVQNPVPAYVISFCGDPTPLKCYQWVVTLIMCESGCNPIVPANPANDYGGCVQSCSILPPAMCTEEEVGGMCSRTPDELSQTCVTSCEAYNKEVVAFGGACSSKKTVQEFAECFDQNIFMK